MMPNQQQSVDHDILIRVETSLDSMIREMKSFMIESENRHQKIVERVAILENKDGRDSERFKTIADDIRRSLANSERIRANEIEVTNLKTEMAEMRKKSNIIDSINAVGVVVAGVVGSIFGGPR
jgi:hypothetical protein